MHGRLIRKVGGVTAAAAAALALTAGPASAHSATSNYYYPGGDRLEASVWIASFSWSGCGNWQTKAYLYGSNPSRASWIKNTAKFHANGVGASVSGGSLSGSGNDASASWTNYNAWSSDLAGNVCGNWLTWYISAASTATSYVPQYGSPRSATAQV